MRDILMNARWPKAVALVLVVLASPAALAGSTDAACWNRTIERIDHYSSPPEGGDNSFFTAATSTTDTTNVALLYPAKASMKGFVHRLYRIRVDEGGTTPTGCTNAYLNNLNYFMPTDVTPPVASTTLVGKYSPTKTYPDPGPTYSGGGGQSDGLQLDKVYRFRNWPANGGGTAEDASAVCQDLAGDNFGAWYKDCMACLDTKTGKGYWLNPKALDNDNTSNAGVFTTNFLRFYPPKWTLLSLAYKRLINGPLLSTLREGVIATNGTKGGELIQMMLPQSCGGQGRPLNQKQKAIDSLSYTSNANPLAEMLLNAAWYMGGQESPWQFDSGALPSSSDFGNKSGPCTNCRGDFLVLFSDGRSDEANPLCRTAVKKSFCTATASSCSAGLWTFPVPLGMGAEDDGNDFFTSTVRSTIPKVSYANTCDEDFADDVANYFYKKPTTTTKPNSVITTFVVGIGDKNSPYGELDSLRAIASASNTTPIFADNFRDLENGIEQVMKTIISTATSFSSAALTTVQTRGYTSAYIPRFNPDDGAQWKGALSHFSLFNEFSSGCTEADYNKITKYNPNGDASCRDVYLTDRDYSLDPQNAKFVGELNGQFLYLDNSKPWDMSANVAGWPFKAPASVATPVWEANAQLYSRVDSVLNSGSSNKRKIYTVVSTSSDGTYDTAVVSFDASNAAKIAPMMKLGGVSGMFCQTLAGYTRSTYASEAECAADVIRFLHGEDRLLQNPKNRPPLLTDPTKLKPRESILGDIFHSTPVLVTPPVPTLLCNTGMLNQCLNTLYRQDKTQGGQVAYATYVDTYKKRDQVVLVGANDGMLHAFHAGAWHDATSTQPAGFDSGTGEELWAFIPPEVLPKLIRYVVGERHELMVDGTPMVRDVWVDGSGVKTTPDRVKQADEYHTVVVMGQREGGRGFFALDVTDVRNPRYLWSSLKPGTREALDAGESWNDLGPSAPPVGPIAEEAADGTFSVGGVKSAERWIVGLGGGYDPAFIRGRSINFHDVWTGQLVYRFAHSDAPQAASDPRSKLFPVAAPVSLVDTNDDSLFDLAVVGDTAGQLWTVNLLAPGTNASKDPKLPYDNWMGARAFVQFKGGSFAQRSPFFQRAAITWVGTGQLRAFLGSGDRDNIKQPNGGGCSVQNLGACMRKGCSVSVSSSRYRVGNAPSGDSSGHNITGSWSYSAGGVAPVSTLAYTATSQQASCSDVADVNLSYSITCGSNPTLTSSSPAYCDWGATDSNLECPVDLGRTSGGRVDYTKAVTSSRFYAITLFTDGGPRARYNAATVSTYDGAALTDTDLVNADVTTTDQTTPGWYVVHQVNKSSNDERTASAALIFNGCVLWNTLEPNAQETLACGATTLPPDTAYLYASQTATGAIKCGSAGSATDLRTTRAIARSTYIAPQQPIPVVAVNSATGEISYSSISLDPGSPPTQLNVGGGNIMGPVHWLEVPRSMHDCRHNGTNCTP